MVGGAPADTACSGILPDVRVSGDERSYAERAEDCLKRRNCPPATDRDPFVADPGHYSLGGSFHW
nr:hypothetical protein [Pseudomonas aeruginosa]